MHAAGRTTIVVADGELQTSLCVARSLAAAGYRVVAAGRSGGGALRSARVARAVRLPAASPAYAEGLVALARAEGAAAVFPHYERTLLELHRLLRGAPPVVVGAAPALVELCAQKSRVLEVARRAGVEVPDTAIAEASTAPAELRALVGALVERHGWPLYAKADSELGVAPGLDSRYMVLRGAGDLGRLEAFVRERGRVLVQERIAGGGCGIAGLFAGGRPACVGGHVRLREAHASGGVSTYCAARIVGDARRAAERLMEALGFTGVAMVEFKIRTDGPPVLMEVNPRIWGTLALYVRAGADVPRAALEHALDGRLPAPPAFEEGVRMRALLADLVAIRRQHRGPRRWVELARALAETPWIVPETTFSLRDPAPFLGDLTGTIGARLRRGLGYRARAAG
jgi:predicted ATP-grasp superfamily ATP-dependent carboligase